MDALRGAATKPVVAPPKPGFSTDAGTKKSEDTAKPKQGSKMAPPSKGSAMDAPSAGSKITAPQTPVGTRPSNDAKIAAPVSPAISQTEPAGTGTAASAPNTPTEPGATAPESTPPPPAPAESAPASEVTTTPTSTAIGNQAEQAVTAALTAPVQPTEDGKFSTANTSEIAFSTVLAAQAISIGVVNGDAATVAEAQQDITAIRQQLSADGATADDLAEFDNTVTGYTRDLARFESGEQLSDEALADLDNADTILTTGNLAALTDTDASRTERLTVETNEFFAQESQVAADSIVGQVVEGIIPPSEGTDFAALSTEQLGQLAEDNVRVIGEAIPQFVIETFETGAGLDLDNPVVTTIIGGQQGIAGVRNQLAVDGATAEELTEFDKIVNEAVFQVALQSGQNGFGDTATLSDNLSALSGIQPAAFGSTDQVRDARNNTDFSLPAATAADVDNAIDGALANDGQIKAVMGDVGNAGRLNIEQVIANAGDLIASGVINDDAEMVADGQNQYGEMRAELTRLGTPSAEIGAVDTAFKRYVQAQAQAESQTDPSEIVNENSVAALITREAREDIRIAVDEAISPDEPFVNGARTRSTSSFEGDNGRPSVEVMTLDITEPRFGRGLGHQEAIENLIETQLQDAGQSYSLTNIESSGAFGLQDGLIEGLELIAAAAPDVATVSSVLPIQPDFVNRVFADMSAARELPGADPEAFEILDTVDLTGLSGLLSAEPVVTLENIDDYADALREFAVRSDEFSSFLSNDADKGLLIDLGQNINAYEKVAAAGADIYSAATNDQTFVAAMFAQDEGQPGSITVVGNVGNLDAIQSNEFFLPDEELPGNDGIPEDGFESGFYRGGGIDVYAPGDAPGLLNGSVNGASFASPDMAVNAILGRFDPRA